MKSFNILLVVFVAIQMANAQENSYSEFGTPFSSEQVTTTDAMTEAYQNLKVGDSLNITFEAKINDVCQAKGCWMNLQLSEQNEVLVKFKDYGFFVPTDIAGNQVTVNGKAFIEELSVDEQRHYALDAGKSKAEIAKITKPKKTLRFEATGVQVEE